MSHSRDHVMCGGDACIPDGAQLWEEARRFVQPSHAHKEQLGDVDRAWERRAVCPKCKVERWRCKVKRGWPAEGTYVSVADEKGASVRDMYVACVRFFVLKPP